jgi:hypothetical protein
MFTGAPPGIISPLAAIFQRQGLTLKGTVRDGLNFFRRHQQPDGALAMTEFAAPFRTWEMINALKSIGSWRCLGEVPEEDVSARLLSFLKTREQPSGMISWGDFQIGPAEYCAETSAEYIRSLSMLGHHVEARSKASFLKSQQLPSGGWAVVHPNIPQQFQVTPSVTALVLSALVEADLEPNDLDAALNYLSARQVPEGHFGFSRLYYNTPLYYMRPTTEMLGQFGYHGAVAAARDFVLAQQCADGGWPATADDIAEASSRDLHSGFALEILAHARMSARDRAVRRGAIWLIERRRADGSWPGGRYPYPANDASIEMKATQDIYATAQVLMALAALRKAEGLRWLTPATEAART